MSPERESALVFVVSFVVFTVVALAYFVGAGGS